MSKSMATLFRRSIVAHSNARVLCTKNGMEESKSSSPNGTKKTASKWLKETLFERVGKIKDSLKKTELDPGPVEFLFPKTARKFQVNIGKTQRCGALGIKLGLTHLWLSPNPQEVLCTMIHIADCQVLEHIRSTSVDDKRTKHTLVVGVKNATPEEIQTLRFEHQHYFERLGVAPKLAYRGFTVHPDNVLAVGTTISACHFTPGQKLQISGISKDKGFLGVMQRWGFKGLPNSHGVSKYHRGRGSVISLKKRVMPRTKMAGHAGMESRYVNGVEVLRINKQHNVIYVRGSVPGPLGQVVAIRDWWNQPSDILLHYPTFKDKITSPKTDLFAKNVQDPAKPYITVQKKSKK